MRKNCFYYLYKRFAEAWNHERIGRIMATRPSFSTRISVALRHSGYLLAQLAATQRMILLITDGKPMDRDDSPETRYAQYDVRKACDENQRNGIHTFCISTAENSRADMEILFPRRRFLILSDMRQLPIVLPRLYLHITT